MFADVDHILKIKENCEIFELEVDGKWNLSLIFGHNISVIYRLNSLPLHNVIPTGALLRVERTILSDYISPEREKIVEEKWCYFRIPIFSNKFSQKTEKNSNFHQNFLTISQPIVFFVQTRENFTRGFEILCKIGENTAFLQFSSGTFCKFSKILWPTGGIAPRTHYEAGPRTSSPPNCESGLHQFLCPWNLRRVCLLGIRGNFI